VLRGVTEEMMIEGGMNTDYEELARVTGSVRDIFDAASKAHVTSPAGTDIVLNLEGSSAFSLDGYFHDYGFSALPGGESPTCPQKEGTDGTVVIDYSMDNLGQLSEPIELTLEDGTVTEITGGPEADELRQIVDNADGHPRNLAEFAIGTNPDARLIGNLAEDKKQSGTIHLAIGDDTSLGGELQSEIHFDGLVRGPTVTLDSETVVEDGVLQMTRVTELAEQLRDSATNR
jgi:leucyl aminopeptidase (aminopeptidase T)